MSKSKYPTTLRMKPWEEDEANKGAKCAKKIRLEIERLLGDRLKLKQTHPSVEGGYIPGYHDKGEDLDYNIYRNGKLIAILDVSCLKYTFEGSQIMPIRFYKGDVMKRSKVPGYIIEEMMKETGELKDRCIWIRGKDVIKHKPKWGFFKGKNQRNHMTNKNDWHRGLDKLVDELLKIAERSKQTRLN